MAADARIKITLRCEECKQRNYNTVKNKKNTSDRLERNKYCPFCRKHTKHVETKEVLKGCVKRAEEKKTSTAPAKPVTAVKKDDTKPGFFKRIGKWFREMKSELKKVIWPTPKTLLNNTLISVVMMVASAIVIWGFDELAQMLVRALFTLAG